MRRIDILKTREVLRLRHELGLSLREIGQVCSCGKTTVSEILMRAKRAEIVWPIGLSDKQLMSKLYIAVDLRSPQLLLGEFHVRPAWVITSR